MEIQSFMADTVAEAVEQIRTQLGPEAVALHVRPLPSPGVARLWRKPRIEVLAYVPAPESPAAPNEDSLNELKQQLEAIKSRLNAPVERRQPKVRTNSRAVAPRSNSPRTHPEVANLYRAVRVQADADGWHLQSLFQGLGLLPVFAQRLKDEILQKEGGKPPASAKAELDLATEALRRCWRGVSVGPLVRTHIFVGPPGVGKSTLLCKEMARQVLAEGRTARVLQLDGRTANPNGLVNIYGDILGVAVERSYPSPGDANAEELLFVDLPGVDCNDSPSLLELRRKLGVFENAAVHLVLNGAYETTTLLAQARAFSGWPVTDLAITHLDEEKRWGKLWNLLLGTNYTLGWLSAGQNIPGTLRQAAPDDLL